MEKILFEKLDENILSKGNQWNYLIEHLQGLRRNYKVDPDTFDSILNVEHWIADYQNLSSGEYIERINTVKSLIGRYWKVSRVIPTKTESGTDTEEKKPLCYLYTYDMNTVNNLLFAIVSAIDLDDFLFSHRRALGEISFDYMQLGNYPSYEKGLLFEEVDKDEMLKNAHLQCETLFENRYKKMEEASYNKHVGLADQYGIPSVCGKCAN